MTVKKEYRTTSSLSWCDTCCNCIGSTGLQVLNLLDFIVGITLSVMGLWMMLELNSEEKENVNIRWIMFVSLFLGAMIVCIALLGFIAVTSADCRKAILPSSYLSLFIAFLAAGTAITQFIKRSKFESYIDDEEAADSINGDDANSLKILYVLTSFMNVFEVVSSFIRFSGSRAFYNSSVKIDNDFTNTLLKQERSMDEQYDANRSKVYAKYDGLRDHYRAKYVEKNDKDDEA